MFIKRILLCFFVVLCSLQYLPAMDDISTSDARFAQTLQVLKNQKEKIKSLFSALEKNKKEVEKRFRALESSAVIATQEAEERSLAISDSIASLKKPVKRLTDK